MSDITMLQRNTCESELAQNVGSCISPCRTSTIRSTFNENSTRDAAVSTKKLIRNCALSIQPGFAPAALDAKEIVMAALHFLSSSWQPQHISDKTPAWSSSTIS